jgi:prephenate dehydrogenase
MTVQITIIGLGQIGASIGLALAEHKELLYRVGHDRDFKIAHQAEKAGVVDKIENNLPRSVRDAGIVLLSLPMDQVRETLEYIAPDLKEGTVVMDTGPVKDVVAGWAAELLPEGRHYVGLTPVLNPRYLYSTDAGLQAARADLFGGGLMAIVTPPKSSSEAIKLAADLTRLLGANPLFADPVEMDGLMAATQVLPQLIAASLANATMDQPGWREGRKIAGRDYAEATGPLAHLWDSKTLAAAASLNRENVLRMLDSVMASMQAMRNDIDQKNEDALNERLNRAFLGRSKWWQERQSGEWSSDGAAKLEMPEAGGFLGRMFGMSRKSDKSKK